MHTEKAQKLSEALIIVRDSYYAKANDLPYSKLELASANQYLVDICIYIDNRSDDVERDFLFSCLGALDELEEEGDFTKISRYADAIHRVPLLFCGEESWNDEFKNRYIIPFCQAYGNEWFEELLSISIPKRDGSQKANKIIYRYNEDNLLSLPGYFCWRMFFPLLTLPFILGCIIFVRYSAYTENNPRERYEITVTACEYENTEEDDYLYISCKEFEEDFIISRFFEYSNSPEKLIELCEAGETLVAYAKYKEPDDDDPYYKVFQLEGLDGTVYRSYEQTTQPDRYIFLFLVIVALVVFVPFFTLFLMMLIVALNRQRFISHPRLVKFCFPGHSLSIDKRLLK